MLLLTFASKSAESKSHTLAYDEIAKMIGVPIGDVEMWVIDVIRAGLVEGKLDQTKRVFLIRRCTYRVFGLEQWKSLENKLQSWKESLNDVLAVVDNAKSQAQAASTTNVVQVEVAQ
jgi:translation initiation factor 3 subunit M